MVRFYRPCKVQFFHGGVKAFVSLCRELHRSEAVDIEVVTAAPIQVQRIEAFGATHCPTYCAWQEVILRFVSASTSGKARTRIKHRRDGAVTITDEYQTHVVATEADLLDFIRAQLAASPCDCLLVDADELVNESSAVGPPVFTVCLRSGRPLPVGCAAHALCQLSLGALCAVLPPKLRLIAIVQNVHFVPFGPVRWTAHCWSLVFRLGAVRCLWRSAGSRPCKRPQ